MRRAFSSFFPSSISSSISLEIRPSLVSIYQTHHKLIPFLNLASPDFYIAPVFSSSSFSTISISSGQYCTALAPGLDKAYAAKYLKAGSSCPKHSARQSTYLGPNLASFAMLSNADCRTRESMECISSNLSLVSLVICSLCAQ